MDYANIQVNSAVPDRQKYLIDLTYHALQPNNDITFITSVKA